MTKLMLQLGQLALTQIHQMPPFIRQLTNLYTATSLVLTNFTVVN